MHSLFAAPTQTQTHMKKAVTHKKSTSHKKSIHSHTQKQHAHHKKHSIQKKHSLQHAQLRNPVMDNQERQESSEEAVQEKPLNHNLATVNLTHFTSRFPANFMHTVKKSVVDFVEKTVDNLHYSSYKLGGKRFDPARGVYIVDCSNFVDNILQNVYPDAYSSLVNSVGADNPASQHYFNFFHDLASASDSHWNKVNDVEQLQPGDILVFRYKNSRGAETGGHVMVVMEKPEQASDVFFVRVADSAPSRHSEDTRHLHESGIGIGTLLLKANPITGKPSAFAWGVNGYWNKNVKFAMARPVGIDT
jgi:cell wall-associated NlpC family hydrolase